MNYGSKLGSRKGANDPDDPWDEVAKFNKLLDIKIKLDEASEQKRKVDIQRAYLDQQVQAKANHNVVIQREKNI